MTDTKALLAIIDKMTATEADKAAMRQQVRDGNGNTRFAGTAIMTYERGTNGNGPIAIIERNEFPIAPPPARYPVIGKYDDGRIWTHEDRYEPWAIDDIVNVEGTIWWVRDEGRKRGGLDITAEYNDMIDAHLMADIDATEYDNSPAGQS
jgi:hypothetical protein